MIKSFMSGLLLAFAAIHTADATEYIYRDVMANTLPTAQCNIESVAKEVASKDATLQRYGKRVCQMQGYGWHLESVKESGTSVCNVCPGSNDKQKCYQEDMVVACKRIKPGTVGMLPGKG
ncbi:MAG: hypothetical protein PHH11_17185 [Methylomonas sp.]|nr:hypothetical protein [Methylomonas sp.]